MELEISETLRERWIEYITINLVVLSGSLKVKLQ